jgi:hypothetical protein
MKACTGDVLQDLLDQNNPNFQLDAVGAETDFVTLSIGGNDVDFFAILKKCVFGIGSGDCDGLLSSAN